MDANELDVIPPERSSSDESWALWINLVLGVWLILTAFAWVHTPTSQVNTLVVGTLVVAFSIASMYAPRVRWANTVVAIWLFVSAFFIHHATIGSLWNNAIVAIMIFFTSLVPIGASTRSTRPPGHAIGT